MADQQSVGDEDRHIIGRDHSTAQGSTGGGTYCFSDASNSNGEKSTLQIRIPQSFGQTSSSSEMYNFSSETSMYVVGFQPPKIHEGSFFDKPAGDKNTINPSYSKGIITSDRFLYQQHQDLSRGNNSSTHHHHRLHGHENYGGSPTVLDDPNLSSSTTRCVMFPCEANERPGQGLSLSLSSSNPSSIGIQSFELRRRDSDDLALMRFETSSSSSRTAINDDVIRHNLDQQQQSSSQFRINIANSKYLGPAKEFLNELCSLGVTEQSAGKMKARENDEDERSVKIQQLYSSLDPVELQRRKTKLLHMLEEVNARYEHYRNHMKGIVSPFEAMAGNGSAEVYSALALKAMSRHFRCVRDGIVSQIKATNKAIRGETSRLLLGFGDRIKPLQQMSNSMETHHWMRRRRGLPEKPVSILRAWLFEHFLHPYPSDADKQMLALKTGLTRSQVSNWYINARVRLWKPMVEEMYLDEIREEEEEEINHSVAISNPNLDRHGDHQNQLYSRNEDDHKPTHDQILRIDHSTAFRPTHRDAQQLEFLPYRGGVSLSLGLHNQNAVTSGGESLLPFSSSSSSQSSIYFNNPIRLYDEDHGQNLQALPLGDLIGAQFLHDLDNNA